MIDAATRLTRRTGLAAHGYGAAMNDAVGRWREFERILRERELDWALHYAPAQLRHARSPEHPAGARLEHLQPADYRAFVAEVGVAESHRVR